MTHDAGGAATTTARMPELAEVDAGVEHGHGSESFFVVGEGLLGESARRARARRRGGRSAASAAEVPLLAASGPKGKPNTKAAPQGASRRR